MENLIIRKSCDKDTNFIYNSWLKSFRNSPLARDLTNDVYYYWQGILIKHLLDSSTCYILEDKENDNIIGYIVVDSFGKLPVVHYGYVKFPFRHMGFFSRLIRESIGENKWYLTHSTNSILSFTNKFNCVYMPYIAYTLPKI